VLLLLGDVAVIIALRRGKVIEAGLFLLWAHLTLQSERHVTLAAVTLAPIIAEQLTYGIGRIVSCFEGAIPHCRTLGAMEEPSPFCAGHCRLVPWNPADRSSGDRSRGLSCEFCLHYRVDSAVRWADKLSVAPVQPSNVSGRGQ
jgi:hypothetical protein